MMTSMAPTAPVRLPRAWHPTPPDAPVAWLGETALDVDPLPSGDARRAWSRWITGHQACLACWRLAGMNLLALRRGTPDVDGLVRDTELLFRTSAAMVRYAGSCTSDVYASVVRPSMVRCHPGFTGRWSLDYAPLPELIHTAGERGAIGKGHAEVLRAAFATYTRVHARVARRLVPGGGSLLREHRGRDALAVDHAAGAELFDAFFLVERGPATVGYVRAALRRRLGRIAADLRADQAPGLTQAATRRS